MSYSFATGKGAVKTGKQLKPFGKLKLSVRKKGKKNVSGCQSLKFVTQPVVLKGKWAFNTHSHGKNKWGKKRRSGKFKGSVSYSVGGGSCGSSCTRAVTWNATHDFGTFNQVAITGTVAGANSTLVASRNVMLAKPNGASRSDSVLLSGHTNQKASFKKGTAEVTVGSSAGVKGSATLTGPSSSSLPAQPCGNGHTQSLTTWDSNYKNGSTPLAIKEQIEGPLKIPNISISDSPDDASISKSKVR